MNKRIEAKDQILGWFDGIVIIMIWCFIGYFILNVIGFNTDPTDKSAWERSGLKYFKDYGTGKEYIAGPDGRLIERD